MKILCCVLLVSLLFTACSSSVTSSPEIHSDPIISSTETETTVTEPPTTESPTDASQVTEPADFTLHVESGSFLESYSDPSTGDYLDYYLYLPENAVVDMPLVIFLHGDGNVGNVESLANNELIQCIREIYGNSFPFIMIAPCTRVTSWVSGTIPETAKHLIDYIAAEYSVDPDRITITGYSRGAIGVWHMISVYGDYFSAAVPVSCGNDGILNLDNCALVPILAFAGTYGENEIRYCNAMQNNVIRIQQAGGYAEMRVLDGFSHLQTPFGAYTDETFQWMLAQ